MLDRLRNTGYTPKQYNELFMTITNELRHLDIFIDDLFSRDHMVRNFKLLLKFFFENLIGPFLIIDYKFGIRNNTPIICHLLFKVQILNF